MAGLPLSLIHILGGENTHAVIAAHRGLPSAALFTDLDQMTEGNHLLFSETPAGQISLHTNYFLWVLVGLLVTGCFVFLLWRWDKKKR